MKKTFSSTQRSRSKIIKIILVLKIKNPKETEHKMIYTKREEHTAEVAITSKCLTLEFTDSAVG